MAVWQVPGETEILPLPPFTVRRAELQAGPAEIRLDAHLVTYSPQTAMRRQRIDGGPWHEVTARAGSVGFLPARTLLEADFLEPTTLAAIEVQRAWPVGAGAAPTNRLLSTAGVLDLVAFRAAELIEAVARDPEGTAHLLMPVEQVIAGILGRLANHTGDGSVAAAVPAQLDDRRMARVQAFVEENLHRSITLADIAEAAALSPNHFCRLFRASIGLPPVRYVYARRIARARSLLLNHPAMMMTEMSFLCGFASQSHFNDVFKRETGMSPGAYRRAHGGAVDRAGGG